MTQKLNSSKKYRVVDENGEVIACFRNKLSAMQFVNENKRIYLGLKICKNPEE